MRKMERRREREKKRAKRKKLGEWEKGCEGVDGAHIRRAVAARAAG